MSNIEIENWLFKLEKLKNWIRININYNSIYIVLVKRKNIFWSNSFKIYWWYCIRKYY